ncbi:hypothetical protein M378DRAFT_313609 [Amanita muscaria Koide BX008]|uniref:Uncharacterized protein n=1 Tax=Amanita muscaria (strain Koide BX008) TaxID=946122 RepID=A0A0C2WBC8_AMAMK|nr:hypothetical protein M378DRAFT_313609 [Amanita muscaria Koide BX008]
MGGNESGRKDENLTSGVTVKKATTSIRIKAVHIIAQMQSHFQRTLYAPSSNFSLDLFGSIEAFGSRLDIGRRKSARRQMHHLLHGLEMDTTTPCPLQARNRNVKANENRS